MSLCLWEWIKNSVLDVVRIKIPKDGDGGERAPLTFSAARSEYLIQNYLFYQRECGSGYRCRSRFMTTLTVTVIDTGDRNNSLCSARANQIALAPVGQKRANKQTLKKNNTESLWFLLQPILQAFSDISWAPSASRLGNSKASSSSIINECLLYLIGKDLNVA